MTDFDARLRHRLQRLDAAVPTTPWIPAAEPTRMRIARRKARSRPRRRLVVLLAAAAGVGVPRVGVTADPASTRNGHRVILTTLELATDVE
jgi:hypothetical protein